MRPLALLAACLDDRPVLVFDEWAADQDPAFRERFYTDILARLRAQGRTILVITHDDRYFELADQLLVMEYGRLRALPDVLLDLGGEPAGEPAPTPPAARRDTLLREA